MEKEFKKRVVFDLPGQTTFSSVLYSILNDNGIKETIAESVEKSKKGEESKSNILADAAIVIAKKDIPLPKLVEFLKKHLKTSQEIAEKIIAEVNEKLIPYAKIINEEQAKRAQEAELEKREDEIRKAREERRQAAEQEVATDNEEELEEQAKKEAFAKAKEELFAKIGVGKKVPQDLPVEEDEPLPRGDRKPNVSDVEKNAQAMQHVQKREVQAPAEPAPTPEAKKPVDPYKEPIE